MAKTLGVAILCALALRAQEPARSLPDDAVIFLELQDGPALLREAQAAPALQPLWPLIPGPARKLVAALGELSVEHIALGVRPEGLFRPLRWTAVVKTQDHRGLLTQLRSHLPGTIFSRPEGEWVVLGNHEEAIERPESGASLADVPSFSTYRTKHTRPRLGFHVDLEKLLVFRGAVGKADDLGAEFFFGHLLKTAARADWVSGALTLDSEWRLEMMAPGTDLPDTHAFLRAAKSAPPLLVLPNALARLSLTRNAQLFWAAREQLAKPAEREALARFQGQAETILGELAYDDLLAALGPTLDLYALSPSIESKADPLFPAVAIVIPLLDPGLEDELILTFQSIIGVANIERGGMGQPRFLLESADQDGVRIHVARHFDHHLNGPGDPRGQLQIALACTEGRFILGSHPDVVRAVVVAARAGRTEPRRTVDSLQIELGPARALFRRNLEFLAARNALEEGKSLDRARTDLQAIVGLFEPFSRLKMAIDQHSGETSVEVVLVPNPAAATGVDGK